MRFGRIVDADMKFFIASSAIQELMWMFVVLSWRITDPFLDATNMSAWKSWNCFQKSFEKIPNTDNLREKVFHVNNRKSIDIEMLSKDITKTKTLNSYHFRAFSHFAMRFFLEISGMVSGIRPFLTKDGSDEISSLLCTYWSAVWSCQ